MNELQFANEKLLPKYKLDFVQMLFRFAFKMCILFAQVDSFLSDCGEREKKFVFFFFLFVFNLSEIDDRTRANRSRHKNNFQQLSNFATSFEDKFKHFSDLLWWCTTHLLAWRMVAGESMENDKMAPEKNTQRNVQNKNERTSIYLSMYQFSRAMCAYIGIRWIGLGCREGKKTAEENRKTCNMQWHVDAFFNLIELKTYEKLPNKHCSM